MLRDSITIALHEICEDEGVDVQKFLNARQASGVWKLQLGRIHRRLKAESFLFSYEVQAQMFNLSVVMVKQRVYAKF
jgi:hypothetical protein